MPSVLLRKVGCMFKISRLATNSNGSFQVEWKLVSITIRRAASRLSLDETIKTSNVLELCVSIQEERRVVGVSETACVEILKVGYEVIYSLCVQKLVLQLYSAFWAFKG